MDTVNPKSYLIIYLPPRILSFCHPYFSSDKHLLGIINKLFFSTDSLRVLSLAGKFQSDSGTEINTVLPTASNQQSETSSSSSTSELHLSGLFELLYMFVGRISFCLSKGQVS